MKSDMIKFRIEREKKNQWKKICKKKTYFFQALLLIQLKEIY